MHLFNILFGLLERKKKRDLEGHEVCSDVSIVGGKDVKKALSWMVSIQKEKIHICGGILIHKQWVLTSAQCKEVPVSSVTVLIGSLSLSKGSQRIGILNYEIPKTFNEKTKEDDIMLIRLSKKVKAKPYKIPKNEKDVPPGTKCVVRGWGTTDYKDEQASDKLQMLEVLVVDRDQCNRYYNRNPVITKDMLCAGNTQQHRGTCWGDSGGPLECKKNLVGVISGSQGCGIPKKPTVYTFLSKRHISWINSILRQQFNSTRF
ncbi:granzyme K isoform X1 [Danio rerio]|uniref:Granzyme K isoform X1 n=4 Tax=Danio rerio TaxID=7955 RepID=A0AC58IAQ1_DANRE